jgi:hypothetical protein
MANRSTGRKGAPTRKVTKEQSASALLTSQTGTQAKIGELPVEAHLRKGIAELQGLHELLLSNDVDPDVLADFRAALNRVRTAAWAAEQYVIRKEIDQESTSVLSFLAGERIRTAYRLCQALSHDLEAADAEFQRGSLVQLYEDFLTLWKDADPDIPIMREAKAEYAMLQSSQP